MASYETLPLSRQQVYALDVAQVSGRLDLLEDELLARLVERPDPPDEPKPDAQPGSPGTGAGSGCGTGAGSAPGAATPPALAQLQLELRQDGVAAELYPISTKLSMEPGSTPCKGIALDLTPQLEAPTERSMLRGFDAEDDKTSGGSAAFLIEVEKPSRLAPELVLAIPEPSAYDAKHDPRRWRRLSDLPSDVVHVKLEATVQCGGGSEGDAQATAHAGVAMERSKSMSVAMRIDKSVPAVGFVVLVVSLLSISSKGAALSLLGDVPPLLKLFWRMVGTSLVFFPMGIASLLRKGRPKLTVRKFAVFIACAASYTVFNSALFIAFSMTSIGHAYIFCNSHSLIIVAGKLLLRHPLGMLELSGAGLGFSGGLLTTMDQDTTPSEDIQGSSTLGDMVAFAGAFAGVAYLFCAKALRSTLGVRLFLSMLSTASWMLLLPVLLWYRHELGINVSQLSDEKAGLFGWVHYPWVELHLVLVCSLLGTMGFIASMKYFEPLVISVTMLLEPIVATILGMLIGAASMPRWPTFVGGAGMIIGCLLVLLASRKSTVEVNVSDNLVKTQCGSARTILKDAASRLSSRRGSESTSKVRVLPSGFSTKYGSLP